MILDATCGGKMLWFDKNREDVVFLDMRRVAKGAIHQQPNWCVEPSVVADFRNMPFPDGAFDLVVFDPPHASVSMKSIIGMKYGTLFGDTWEEKVVPGIVECWRVLSCGGTLVFKWAETVAKVGDVLDRMPDSITPAFGHVTAKSGKTIWVCFHKTR